MGARTPCAGIATVLGSTGGGFGVAVRERAGGGLTLRVGVADGVGLTGDDATDDATDVGVDRGVERLAGATGRLVVASPTPRCPAPVSRAPVPVTTIRPVMAAITSATMARAAIRGGNMRSA